MHVLTNKSRLCPAVAVPSALLVIAISAPAARAAYDIGQYVSLLLPAPKLPSIGITPTATLTLPAGVNNLSSFALRFKLNGSDTGDYGYVDDVVVAGTPTAVTTPPQTQTVALRDMSTTPINITENDASQVELGVPFESAQADNVTGIRFYMAPPKTGTHTVSLYSSTGTLLARATFTNETATGWQEVTFSTPGDIAANTTYLASYHTPADYYSLDSSYFTDSHAYGILTAPGSSTSGGNGAYVYSVTPARPVNTWTATNYWVTPMVLVTN